MRPSELGRTSCWAVGLYGWLEEDINNNKGFECLLQDVGSPIFNVVKLSHPQWF